MIILYLFIAVWVTVLCMVICALCLARHQAYVLDKEGRSCFESRAQEIKDHTIIKVCI